MRKTAYVVLSALLFLGSASFAFADTAPLPGFWCDPYSSTFTDGQAYIPTDGGLCNFVPASISNDNFTQLYVFKGTVGSSTLINSRFIFPGDIESVYSQSNNVFGASLPGDSFFAASDFGDGTADVNYLTTNAGTPPPGLEVLAWHWGAPATVTADTLTSNIGTTPPLTSTISGFINGETLNTSGITGEANCTTTATNTSPVGDYPITCERGTLSSTKYAIDTFVDGTLHLVNPPPPAPTCSLTANPTSIVQGNNSTLTFSSINATGGTIDNGVGAVSAAGTASVSPSLTTTYTDTVSGAGGTATCSATVTVTPPVITDHQAPVIVITNPLKNGVYAKTDSVLLTATVTDASPLATTTYWFGTKKINPAQPLPLSTVSTPSIQSVSVSATDVYGNTSTTTLKFFVVKTTNSCLLDIIQVLILIGKDKTLPDKPTLQNLISDCSALIKGLHRYDDTGHNSGNDNSGHGSDNSGHNDQDDNHGGNNNSGHGNSGHGY